MNKRLLICNKAAVCKNSKLLCEHRKPHVKAGGCFLSYCESRTANPMCIPFPLPKLDVVLGLYEGYEKTEADDM